MDMSKLPRLSQTNKNDAPTPISGGTPAPPAPSSDRDVPDDQFRDRVTHDPGHGVGAEVWISIAVGAILLLMFRRLLQYMSHVLFGTFFAPYLMPDGTAVPYTSTLDFWSDLGVTAFAFVLIVEGVALAVGRRQPGVIWFAFVLTVLATLYNFGFLIITFTRGFPLISAFAVAFGVYIALYQWNLLKGMSRRTASGAAGA